MRARLESASRARDEHGVRGAVHVVPIADPAECAPGLRALLAGDVAPTALIAGNDWMTAPLLGAVQELGLAIPEDVSVVAYGDSRWAAAYRPPLSVIRYDYREEGETLASRLLARLGEAADAAASARGLVPDEFLERGSTGVPRTRHGAREQA